MDFDAWTNSAGDPVRRKRLLLGYVVGMLTVSLVSTFVVLTSKKAAAQEEDDPVIEAQLASEPEPEPEPAAPPPKPEAAKPPPPRPKIKAPVEVPQEPLKEAEANKAELASEGDPFQRDESTAEVKVPEPTVVAPPAPPPPPKPIVKAEKKGPIRVTEEVTPPSPLAGQARPEYPADAKSRGIEGTVIVKYVVTETGMVTDVKVLRGPEELTAACVAAVKTWRFQPVILDGKPVAVVRVARFPFKIRT